jgi:hypothetical protein
MKYKLSAVLLCVVVAGLVFGVGFGVSRTVSAQATASEITCDLPENYREITQVDVCGWQTIVFERTVYRGSKEFEVMAFYEVKWGSDTAGNPVILKYLKLHSECIRIQ